MKPVSFGNSILVDGDLTKSRAAWQIYSALNTSNTRLLEFRLESSGDGSDSKNPMAYLDSIINTIWYLSTENVYSNYQQNDRYDYIVIDEKDVIMFDFTIDKTTKEMLADKGYNVTKNYLIKTLPEKKAVIKNKYTKVFKNLNLVYNTIRRNNPKEALYTLNEILSDMYEDTKYIDISIYDKIKELKESIANNMNNNFLAFNKIKNEKQLSERIEFVQQLTLERIQELNKYIEKFSNKS